jgi:xylose dehydrogenase (NAD/NADP)
MREEFDYFGHCLLTGQDPHADGEHGLTDMRVMERIYEASEADGSHPV